MDYKKEISNLKKQFKKIEKNFYMDNNIKFKNKNVKNAKNYIDNKMLDIIFDIEILENAFKIETIKEVK